MQAKLGIAPIAWRNDDLAALSDGVGREERPRPASLAGFTSIGTSRRFPIDMRELGPILARYRMSACGETARSIRGVRSAALTTKPKLSEDEVTAYGVVIAAFVEWCAGEACRSPSATTWPSRAATSCA